MKYVRAPKDKRVAFADRGWRLIREALQSPAADLPDVVWVDGVLLVVEP